MALYRKLPVALGLGFALLLASCGGSGSEGEGQGTDTLATEEPPKDAEIIGIGGKLFSIPSPVQTALAIRKAGLKYNKEMTAPLEKGDALTTKAARALAMGVYGADLSYVTVHKDGARAIGTIQAIEKLGGHLGVMNAFDRTLMDRFKANMNNEDSLLRLSGVAFRAADQYLKTNESEDVSVLVLAGGWVESLHLVVNDPAALKDQSLMNRIGEQKRALSMLVELIGASDKDGASAALLAALKELEAEFASITSTYTYAEPVTDASKKTTFINSTSQVAMPAETIAAITAKIAAIRNMILA